MPLHFLLQLGQEVSDYNNFWYNYYVDNRSPTGSLLSHLAYLVQHLSYPEKLSNPENHEFRLNC